MADREAIFAVPVSDLIADDLIKRQKPALWEQMEQHGSLFDERVVDDAQAMRLTVFLMLEAHNDKAPQAEWLASMEQDGSFYDWPGETRDECQDNTLVHEAIEQEVEADLLWGLTEGFL